MSLKISPRALRGPWASGFALDIHTVSSTFLGSDSLGHPQFETVRSPIGELVYRQKYRHDDAVVESIVGAAVDFLSRWKPPVEVLVPAPPSNMARRSQPVLEVARRISEKISLPLCDMCVHKIKATGQMKDFDVSKRIEVLSDAYTVDAASISGRRLLLFDDLYDSGATAKTLTKALLGHGGAAAVYLLTLTQTR
jgi:competence protein ComFC